jgi:hypothetical protein
MKNGLLKFTAVLILISNFIFAGCSVVKEELSKNKNPGNFKAGSEPVGFRNIRWGTDLSALSGMEYLETNPNHAGGLQVYTKKGDDLRIGEAKLTTIKYGFQRGKFYGVTMYAQGYVNWLGLKNAVFEKFGEGEEQLDKINETYSWTGKTVEMLMEYNETEKEARLGIFSAEMDKQEKDLPKEKAKEKL